MSTRSSYYLCVQTEREVNFRDVCEMCDETQRRVCVNWKCFDEMEV